MIDERIQQYTNLELITRGAASMATENPELFAVLRRAGFGGSDSSILLHVNHWTSRDALILQNSLSNATAKEPTLIRQFPPNCIHTRHLVPVLNLACKSLKQLFCY